MNTRYDYGPKGCCGSETALFAACLAAAPWWPALLAIPPATVAARSIVWRVTRHVRGGAR